MIPTLYINDDSAKNLDSCTTSVTIIDNIVCDKIGNEGITVQPLNEMPRKNLILWSIINGFNMFKFAEALIIKFSDDKQCLTQRMFDIAHFVLESEKMNRIGTISLFGKRNYGEILYVQTDSIDYSCFLVSKMLGQYIKDKYSKDVMTKEILNLDFIFKEFNNFELSQIQ